VIDALRRDGDGVSWVKPDNLHYTMRFLGEVGDSGARRVADAADRAVRGRGRVRRRARRARRVPERPPRRACCGSG
jgi:2'-5' RNA ligase